MDKEAHHLCVEPAQIPIQGILTARALSRVELLTCGATSESASNSTGNSSSRVCAMLTNFSDEELILPKATVLGVAEEKSEGSVDRINTKSKTNVFDENHPVVLHQFFYYNNQS
jgi:hypothetical protein